MNWLKKWLLAGVKATLKGAVAKLDDVQADIKNLIIAHGPDAADKIVDLVQAKANGLIDKLIPD